MIANRQRRNSIEHSIKGASATIPGGHAFAEVSLKPDEVLEVWTSDLSEMYHSFWVPSAGALTNAVAMEFDTSELMHLAAMKKKPYLTGKGVRRSENSTTGRWVLSRFCSERSCPCA